MKMPFEHFEQYQKRYDQEESQEPTQVTKTIEFSDIGGEEAVAPEIVQGNITGHKSNLINRKANIGTVGLEPAEFAYERAIGKNDSVYSNFVGLLQEAKKKVGRIVIRQGGMPKGYATGFMVSPNLLLTNWHVFHTPEEARGSSVQFNYELDINGNPATSLSFNFEPSTFFHSYQELDYCLVAVNAIDTTGQHRLADIGFIYLNPVGGKLGDEGKEMLNVIHHPGGDYKQLSIRENKFQKILPTSLWYESDTAQGSSGSPVFNDQWQVVALHHMGIANRDAAGNYIDKNGNIIQPVDGQIDLSKIHWVANAGIRISVIRKHLIATFPNSEIINDLMRPPQATIISAPLTNPISETSAAISPIASAATLLGRPQDSIDISVPASMLRSEQHINISLNTKDLLGTNTESPPSSVSSGLDNSLLLETLRRERNIDYTDCRGYRSDFLGDERRVAIPKALPEIKEHVANLNDSRAYILKYHKYSVIYNKLKKMPLISAINIDGDEEKRKDNTPRKDDWIRDLRIKLEWQLDDKFYLRSGFDRGHMSRREDANWGDTPEEAKRNADLTCMHTNACPQVPTLNRSSRSGLWGKLEKIILEKGAIKEEGRTGRISVFSGPIHHEEDRIYKNVRIPMEFYKLIVWVSDVGELKATAFTLSQSELVSEINFDEELGIDLNADFLEHQCSIAELQRLTKIDFSDLMSFDTFQNTNNNNSTPLQDEQHLLEMLGV